MIKTGLLFGSFNPIHIGHIAIAGFIKEFESVGEIWFVISPQNPFKNLSQLVRPAARLEMIKIAIKEYPAFRVSDIEFNMPLPSFTINTLNKLKEKYPGRDFYLITGTDNIGSIGQWKGGKTLLNDNKFLIYPRLNTDNSGLRKFKNARIVDAPVIELSSTFIRDSILQGKDMRPFLPPGVYDYIIKNGFYSSDREPDDFPE
jgi:nicotinate-nucleotide adenylyltransferase